jgi:hypothetical protein
MGYFSNGFQTERKDDGYGRKFYGKYRAQVTNNMDTDALTGRMGRIKVKCPRVLGDDESTWCTPCVPFSGPGKGMFSIPKIGDTVWIEFEEGDPNKPIWVGNWWGTGEIPSKLDSAYDLKEVGFHHIIDTPEFKLHINDKTKVVTLTMANGFVFNGTVSINGNLNVNQGENGGGNITADGVIDGSNI